MVIGQAVQKLVAADIKFQNEKKLNLHFMVVKNVKETAKNMRYVMRRHVQVGKLQNLNIVSKS